MLARFYHSLVSIHAIAWLIKCLPKAQRFCWLTLHSCAQEVYAFMRRMPYVQISTDVEYVAREICAALR
jgi:hypothetical protein